MNVLLRQFHHRPSAPGDGPATPRAPWRPRPGVVVGLLVGAGLLAAAAALAWDAPVPVGQRPDRPWYILAMLWPLYAILFVICVYTARHYSFTLNRLHGAQRHPYLDIDTADWPEVTVLVPAHNEEPVMEGILTALLDVDYPPGRLHILPIDDRSKDRTGAIVDAFATRHPGIVTPFHRTKGEPGKAAALRDAMAMVTTDIALVFDADYIPGRGLIKQLVAPFFDPEVGAVMGRVVPHNVGQNLLTRLLDLERTGGYQVDQQARMNLKLVPQYGGTVGGVRRRALESVGGWRVDTLAEDTDATFRLLRGGWKTAYQNRSECYEQVPTTWPQRMRQVRRWARGHNEALFAHAGHLLGGARTRFREKLDGWLLLNVYMMSPIVMLGWLLAMALWYLGENRPGLIVILIVTSYSVLGNFATFFEVSAGSYLDGSRARIRLLPLVMLGFLVGLFTITHEAVMQIVRPREPGARVRWSKTDHPHAINDDEEAWP